MRVKDMIAKLEGGKEYFRNSWMVFFFSHETLNGFFFFFLVIRDFISSREPWFSKIIFCEMRKKYLIRREPWFWL